MRRWNLLIGAGIVLILAGVVLAWVVSSDDDEPDEPLVAVVVARADLSSGEAGDDLVAAGKVALTRLPQSEVAAGSVLTLDTLAGTILGTTVAEGGQIPAGALRPAVLRAGAITIPDDKQAVAVTVPFTAGAAGYAGAGDQVNVYVTIPPGASGAPRQPFTKLLLANVEVLDVSTEVAPRRADPAVAQGAGAGPARPEAGQLTFLLALDATDAERLVFAASLNQLWFTVVPDGQADSTTPGVDYQSNYLEAS